MGYKCPECHEEIDHLKYSQSVTEYRAEYGTYNLPENSEENDVYDGEYDCEDSECNDSENGDECEFKCPECDCTIRLSDLEKKDGEDKEEVELTEEEKEERKARIISAPNKFEVVGSMKYELEEIEYAVCQKCRYMILIGENDAELICQKCGDLITKKS